MSWRAKDLKLEVGDKVKYIGDSVSHNGKWKEDTWLKNGVTGTIIKLTDGHPKMYLLTDCFPATDAWATFQFDCDDTARLAITKLNRKDWVKL